MFWIRGLIASLLKIQEDYYYDIAMTMFRNYNPGSIGWTWGVLHSRLGKIYRSLADAVHNA